MRQQSKCMQNAPPSLAAPLTSMANLLGSPVKCEVGLKLEFPRLNDNDGNG